MAANFSATSAPVIILWDDRCSLSLRTGLLVFCISSRPSSFCPCKFQAKEQGERLLGFYVTGVSMGCKMLLWTQYHHGSGQEWLWRIVSLWHLFDSDNLDSCRLTGDQLTVVLLKSSFAHQTRLTSLRALFRFPERPKSQSVYDALHTRKGCKVEFR